MVGRPLSLGLCAALQSVRARPARKYPPGGSFHDANDSQREVNFQLLLCSLCAHCVQSTVPSHSAPPSQRIPCSVSPLFAHFCSVSPLFPHGLLSFCSGFAYLPHFPSHLLIGSGRRLRAERLLDLSLFEHLFGAILLLEVSPTELWAHCSCSIHLK